MEDKKRETAQTETLASEMYGDVKKTNFRLWFLVFVLVAIVVVQHFLYTERADAMARYYIDKLSEYETVIVDSGDGYGHANYVQGDNSGGIFNGEGYSEAQEKWQSEGNEN